MRVGTAKECQVVKLIRLKNIILFSATIGLTHILCEDIYATSFQWGEVDGQFKSSLSMGANWATRNPDQRQIGITSGGIASNNTHDDGRLNFRKGEAFSKVIKGVSDLELKYANAGVFLRGKYWYDFELENGEQHFYRIKDRDGNKAAKPTGITLADAYIYKNFPDAAHLKTIRLGRQTINWGESAFIGNGINIINPLDLPALRRPGAHLKERTIPVNMLYSAITINPKLSMELFYQLEWRKTIVDQCGTFFAVDALADGCGDRLEAILPGFNSPVYLPRADDNEAKNARQFGLAFKPTFGDSNQHKLGLYFINYHSRLPYLSGIAVNGALATIENNAVAGQQKLISNGKYFLDYPENIQLWGASFSTLLGKTSVSGELSYRPNMPLQINGVDLTTAAYFGNMIEDVNSPIFSSGHSKANPDEIIKGYARRPVSQLQLKVIHPFGPIWNADNVMLVAEAGYNHITDINKNALRFGRDGNYGNGSMPTGNNPFNGDFLSENISCTALLNPINPQYCHDDGFYTQNSWGYRARASVEYKNILKNTDIKYAAYWSHDVAGYGPNFNQGSKAVSLSADITYRNSYTLNVAYTDFFGGDFNTLVDRDFASLSLGWNF